MADSQSILSNAGGGDPVAKTTGLIVLSALAALIVLRKLHISVNV